jgi:hypothetical protein
MKPPVCRRRQRLKNMMGLDNVDHPGHSSYKIRNGIMVLSKMRVSTPTRSEVRITHYTEYGVPHHMRASEDSVPTKYVVRYGILPRFE